MPQLNASFPIVDERGTMVPAFRDQQNLLNNALPIVGEGSPESVVPALQFQVYFDSLGTTGSIIYIKMLPDIGGDKTQGWVAV